MWSLLSISYQIKLSTIYTEKYNYIKLWDSLKKKLIYKQERMVELVLFNEIKTPVGASSERLMSESLSCSFKRFVQTADSPDVYAWANETSTQPIRSKHWIIQQWIGWLIWDTLSFCLKCKWPNIIVS